MSTFSLGGASVFVSRTLRLHRSARYNTLDCQKAGFQYGCGWPHDENLWSLPLRRCGFISRRRNPSEWQLFPVFRLIRVVDARPCLFSWCASVQWPRKSFAAFPSRCCWLILMLQYYSFLLTLVVFSIQSWCTKSGPSLLRCSFKGSRR